MEVVLTPIPPIASTWAERPKRPGARARRSHVHNLLRPAVIRMEAAWIRPPMTAPQRAAHRKGLAHRVLRQTVWPSQKPVVSRTAPVWTLISRPAWSFRARHKDSARLVQLPIAPRRPAALTTDIVWTLAAMPVLPREVFHKVRGRPVQPRCAPSSLRRVASIAASAQISS
jgi:hypothetical protein